MQNNPIRILSTRPLSEEIITGALKNNILIETLSFIDTSEINDYKTLDVIKEAAKQRTTVIFTSMNAVEMVRKNITGNTYWQIACIGNTTKQLCAKYFGEENIIAFANDSLALADLIIDKKINEAIFFCGDIRREELPSRLIENGIQLNEIIVYKTIETPTAIKSNYDGILFFSPSAVKSFFSCNHILPDTQLFSIGTTTTNELKRFTSNNIVTALESSKAELVTEMINYFSDQQKVK